MTPDTGNPTPPDDDDTEDLISDETILALRNLAVADGDARVVDRPSRSLLAQAAARGVALTHWETPMNATITLTTSSDPLKEEWAIHDDVIRLREWGTQRTYALYSDDADPIIAMEKTARCPPSATGLALQCRECSIRP